MSTTGTGPVGRAPCERRQGPWVWQDHQRAEPSYRGRQREARFQTIAAPTAMQCGRTELSLQTTPLAVAPSAP